MTPGAKDELLNAEGDHWPGLPYEALHVNKAGLGLSRSHPGHKLCSRFSGRWSRFGFGTPVGTPLASLYGRSQVFGPRPRTGHQAAK